MLDLDTGYSFFAPPTVFNPDVVPNEQSFVLGHDSVRSAPTSNGVMRVSGDNTNQTTVEVYVGGERVKTIQWNGKLLARKKTAYGFLVASISGVANCRAELPTLTRRGMADSLPEVARTYDDSLFLTDRKSVV